MGVKSASHKVLYFKAWVPTQSAMTKAAAYRCPEPNLPLVTLSVQSHGGLSTGLDVSKTWLPTLRHHLSPAGLWAHCCSLGCIFFSMSGIWGNPLRGNNQENTCEWVLPGVCRIWKLWVTLAVAGIFWVFSLLLIPTFHKSFLYVCLCVCIMWGVCMHMHVDGWCHVFLNYFSSLIF